MYFFIDNCWNGESMGSISNCKNSKEAQSLMGLPCWLLTDSPWWMQTGGRIVSANRHRGRRTHVPLSLPVNDFHAN